MVMKIIRCPAIQVCWLLSLLKLLFSPLIMASSAPPHEEAISKFPKSSQVTQHQTSPCCLYLLTLMRRVTLNPNFPKDALQRKRGFPFIYYSYLEKSVWKATSFFLFVIFFFF